MNKFRPELFDKDEKQYIYKREEQTPYGELTLKGHMISNENIDLLTRMIIRELDMDSSLSYDVTKSKVKEYMNGWLNLGKLDDERVLGEIIQHNINVAIVHLNQLFVDTFKENFYEVNDYYKEDVNPFKVTKGGKLHSDMYVEDIRALNVNSQQQLINVSRQFLVRDNKIKHYNILGKGRNYDRKNNEGLNSSGYDKENLHFKSYGNDSMKDLLKYEIHEEFKHLPWSADNTEY